MSQWTDAELAAIEQIEAMEAAESQKGGQIGFDMARPDESAQYRAAFARDVGNAANAVAESDFVKTLKNAGRSVAEFVTGSGDPQPVQLPSLTNPVYREGAKGKEQRYSDGNWYPVGSKPKAQQKPQAQPLQQVEVINGVKYQLTDGKYVRVK